MQIFCVSLIRKEQRSQQLTLGKLEVESPADSSCALEINYKTVVAAKQDGSVIAQRFQEDTLIAKIMDRKVRGLTRRGIKGAVMEPQIACKKSHLSLSILGVIKVST